MQRKNYCPEGNSEKCFCQQKIGIFRFQKLSRPNFGFGERLRPSCNLFKYYSMDKEKSKRGRKPKANPQTNRLWIRLNDKNRERFLKLYERSGKKSYSAFITDCVLNKPHKTVVIDKTLIDFAVLLSSFRSQYRAIGNNYNQVLRYLKAAFPERTALLMLYRLEKATIEFVISTQKIEEYITKFRELCLPK